MTFGSGHGRLAAEVDSFVDRRRELADVRRLLSTARLVTLTGVGGAGKTRLAVRVARGLGRAFADGVWQVDLAGLADGSLLAYAVAETVGVHGGSEVPAARLLADHLADRDLLLLLDNCEHLTGACAELIGGLLPAAAGLRVLCTSRQPLGIVGETVYTVSPLPVGVPDARSNPALALFADRAAAVVPGFRLDAATGRLAAEICRRLDGLPLAIELAAAQLRTRTLRQLHDGLARPFELLTAGPDTPLHRRGLKQTFDWSYALCSPAEQALWTRVTVFAGSFDLAAATAVGGGGQVDAAAMLETLAGLVDKSIVVRGEVAGEVRYRLLETVREYGRSRGGWPAYLRRRHRDWYLGRAERFEAEWFGPDQARWLAVLRADLDNLRAALTFCLKTPGEEQAALRLGAALLYFWVAAGALHEGQLWLERAIAAAPAPTMARARALVAYCRIMVIANGSSTGTADRMRECLALAHRLGSQSMVARAQQVIGLAAEFEGDRAVARELLDRAVRGFAALGEVNADAVLARFSLAMALLVDGDRQLAAAICEECDALCVSRGDLWVRSQVLVCGAVLALDGGEPERAAGMVRKRLLIKRELGDRLGIATSLEQLAATAVARGQADRGARLLGAADRMWRRIGQMALVSTRLRHWRKEYEARARLALGDAGFAGAYRDGHALDDDEVLAYALGEAAAPATPAAPAGRPGSGPVALTRREWQVAELIAEGLSNKQIAARLMVGTRTAESHVENILTKLGFTSRVQVASWVSREGRDSPDQLAGDLS